ncbi:molybdenum cofactor biosynthesis protein MoaE [Alteromonas aestuariivivens]|uniref:Molybdopterin synthase catalytic subunit n=1 Tax=Alteromonas aestuariivivens TaxID=1938339 RepID=A0A3D8M4A0_9ALTE|nr:molybdenum cofactor biosynthesis protein MoaE [Alteromonas aestuariivivens]RDV24476.1 molybdenum cofactor biosynthesis protein MoaE [Alteromonas aestuariivivens]
MFSSVTCDDFDQASLYSRLQAEAVAGGAGAIVTFTGLVRDFNAHGRIEGIELEHYPEMTEQALRQLMENACARFSLTTVGIVHRVGKIANHEQIVWVGSAAPHRQAAFDGACYMMDTLKQAVPLWKKEFQSGHGKWVAAKASDERAALAWVQGIEANSE